MMRFGVAGLGGKQEAIDNLNRFKELGLQACEVAFTYSVYLKKQDAIEIGRHAKQLGIRLSVHAPYWVNLNANKEKREASKQRILKSAEIAYYLQARNVVFHAGYYGKDRKAAFDNIKQAIVEMQEVVEKHNWQVRLCPETMGKVNVFGSIDEISNLVKDTGCGFCIDFAHILARYGKIDFACLDRKFPNKNWHCHFSGIEYGAKGEKRHKLASKQEWKSLLVNLKQLNRDIIIIDESPMPVESALKGKQEADYLGFS
ncbi:MAG: TIM barrel protein [Candidatus Nanoarchaeia archaeon]